MLDKIPKSFFVGLSVASTIAVIGLIVHISLPKLNRVSESDTHDEREEKRQFRPHLPNYFIPEGQSSHLGIFKNAAISTDARRCAKVGKNVLLRNGTAVDAAVATLFCNGVVNSHSMGLGGGFVMTIYIKKDRKVYNLMARETAPSKAHSQMYVNNSQASYKGPLSVAVPGELLGYWEAKRKFGNPDISWESLVEPAIKISEEGIVVSEYFAKIGINKKAMEKIRNDTLMRKIFTDPQTGEFLKVGDTFKRPVLAETLRRVAKYGAGEIYGGGQTGRLLIQELKKAGGIITLEDLRNYKVKWEEKGAVSRLSEDMTVYSSPPPTSGVVVTGILQILNNLNLKPEEFQDTRTYQRFVEAMKFGYAKRTLLGDWNNPNMTDRIMKVVDELTSERFGREKSSLIRDDWTSQDPEYYGAEYDTVDDDGTSHTNILAPNGDAVAVTSTINSIFGSGIMSKETGIVYNNEMDDFSTPGFKNVYGIYPSPSNFIQPGMRPVSSMSPTILLDKNGDVQFMVGGSGGPRIISGIVYVAMQALWLGNNVKEATDLPRIHHQLLPMKVVVEPGAKCEIVNYLREVGHEVEDRMNTQSRFSVIQSISVKDGIITANNDWRKSGEVAGF